MPNYGCKCNCPDFATHVGTGPYVSADATPTQNRDVKTKLDTERRWTKENAAYRELHKQGYNLPHLNGADKIASRATTEVELQHGRLYGDKAPLMQKAVNGEYNA